MSGLGRVKHFDPRNLDYLIADNVVDETAHHAAILATRAPFVPLSLTPAQLSPTLGARTLIGAPMSATPAAGVRSADQASRRATFYYEGGWRGNQGNTPKCTAFSSTTMLADGPVTHPGQNPLVDPDELYNLIVSIDRAEGRYFDDGATSLAMAKALVRLGFVGEYLWGYSLDDFIKAIATGPVLIGIDWYTGMDDPSPADGIIRARGSIRGGHEIEVNGADFDAAMARVKQTWPLPWGLHGKGDALLPFEDLAMLLATGGDMTMYRELPTSIAQPTSLDRIRRDLDTVDEDLAGERQRRNANPDSNEL